MLYFRINEDAKKKNSFLLFVILFFSSFFLDVFQDMAELINNWVFIHVGIYGTTYKDSIVYSYKKISEPKNIISLRSLIIGETFFVFYFFCLVVYSFLLSLVKINNPYITIDVIISFYFVVFLLLLFVGVISTVVETILFIHSENPECIRKLVPDFEKNIAGAKELEETIN